MGLVVEDDVWRMPDWFGAEVKPLLPERPAHPLGCQITCQTAFPENPTTTRKRRNPPTKRVSKDGSDGTRTRDLRRDRPAF
jgi:hypothetical protein